MAAKRSVARATGAAWPVAIINERGTISAIFHPAAEGLPRDTAVIFCSPIGWEAVASHRAQRHLAEQLAAVGFPVLRFDYPGTGDSDGADGDPDRLAAWLSGVDAAIRKMRELAKRSRIALIGFHLGATLAVLGARAIGGVDTLVLWSPYIKGRVFIREARAYRALNGGDSGFARAEDQGGLEAAGFLFSASTLSELTALDLLADKTKAANHVLFLEREEKPVAQTLASQFESSGTVTERVGSPGYLDMMQEPRKSVLPQATLAIIIEYLDRIHPVVVAAAANPGPQSACIRVSNDGQPVVEEAVTFGQSGQFFGVLSEPAESAPKSSELPIVLFLTTASHHRIGPNRMYVPMARALAHLGFTSLRFDLTGVGDTPSTPDAVEGHSYSAAFVNDVRAAMDHLQHITGVNQFVTVGLCSGAYLGFHTSLADKRVVGTVLINSQTFNWREGDSLEINRRVTFMSTRFYRRAALDPKVWQRALRGDVNLRGIGNAMLERWKKRAEVEAQRILRRFGRKAESGRVDIGDAFGTLVKRGTDVLLVYSGHDEGLDYLTSEVGSRLGRLKKRDNFRVEVIDGPDHTFTQLWAQDRLVTILIEHLASRFLKPR